MTGPSPDLAALREKADAVQQIGWSLQTRPSAHPVLRVKASQQQTDLIRFEAWKIDRGDALAAYVAAVSPDVILAVLALVDEQRKENEQLREALGKYAKHDALCARVYDYHNDCTCGLDALRDALAGSPAENKEEA